MAPAYAPSRATLPPPYAAPSCPPAPRCVCAASRQGWCVLDHGHTEVQKGQVAYPLTDNCFVSPSMLEAEHNVAAEFMFLCHCLQLLSAGADGLIKLWSVRNAECLSTFDEHEGKVRRCLASLK